MNIRTTTVLAIVGATAAPVLAQPTPAPAPESTPAPTPAPAATTPAAPESTIKIGGYLETYFQWNLRDPSNGATNLRDYDFRHDALALQNAELEATWTKGALSGRLALQVGDAGDAYYAASDRAFRNVQEAWVAWAAPGDVELAAGLFLSPVGPEVVPVRDNWNWSRSSLFYALPAYHLGVRAKHALGDSGVTLMAMVTNGVNDIVDDNRGKSIALAASYAKGDVSGQVLYFGGPERATGSPEGTPWRHLGDAYVQVALGGGLSVAAHVDGGFESGDLGTSSWYGGAGYVRYDATPKVWLAARGDYFHESLGTKNGMTASPIFYPVAWVASGTATLAYRPADGLDLRLEYRHDSAAADAYFGGDVTIDPVTGAATANRSAQDTVTAGAVAWF